MKNKLLTIFVFITVLFSLSFFPKNAFAHEEGGANSASREAIEQTEERVLGSEKHAELEKVEPTIDASLQKIAPVAVGLVSTLLFVIALYLKLKKKKIAK